MKLYEHIPKEVAEDASLIESENNFEIINNDPDIVFHIGNVKEGDENVIVYTIGRSELSEENPSTMAYIERTLSQTDSIMIRLLFALALVLVLINHFIEKEIYLIKKNL